jgi:hypothetical protein
LALAPPRPTDDTAAGIDLAWLGDAGRSLRTLPVIWATVDMERALVEFGLSPARAAAAVDDPLLGARVLVLGQGDVDTAIALAEPSTEGRLAATLARHGEGPAGRYVGVPIDLDEIRTLAAAAGIAISRPAGGPFGPEVLVLAAGLGGRSLVLVDASGVLVDPAAVPSRP